jgi:hypothetical protein
MITPLDAIHHLGFAQMLVEWNPLRGDKLVTWIRNGRPIADACIGPIDAEVHIYGSATVDYSGFFGEEARRLFKLLVTLAVSSN